ncbi:MAG TPA: hypothetical protein V6D15_22835 [Oculatellaceae cyanobacterium]|jgi:hypothetical protein
MGAKFRLIALVSCLICTATTQQLPAQAKVGGVNLMGNWKESSRVFYWSNSSKGCKANPNVAARKLSVNKKGSSMTIPTFRYWGSPQGQRGAYGAATPKVAGRAVSFTIKGGGFVARYNGTISNDGNKVTGQILCTHSSGKTKASVPFTLTRLNPVRYTPPLNGLG